VPDQVDRGSGAGAELTYSFPLAVRAGELHHCYAGRASRHVNSVGAAGPRRPDYPRDISSAARRAPKGQPGLSRSDWPSDSD
jgi:hypothetical protein